MKKTACTLAMLFCLGVIGQHRVVHAQTTAEVRERVNKIISETMKSGEFTTAGGIRIITRRPPSSADVEEIKRYGDRAVLPLEEHFASEDGFEYETAMRLMGALGGKRIIEPLKKVALHDSSARKREYALRWITQGPWDEAGRVLSHAAAHDPDAKVRKVAQELRSGYAPRRSSRFN
jgi:hypothetical protein